MKKLRSLAAAANRVCEPLLLLLFLAAGSVLHSPVQGAIHHYDFVLKENNFTRLCSTKSMLVVNDSFPGPVIRVYKGILCMSMSITKEITLLPSTGSWYNINVNEVVDEDLATGADTPRSIAFVINGQPGDFCECS
ncbi:laccase-17-like [Punica granatum]|uniref:Laccase-17-like n=1 Tax=Punica granatum TaxID=22663 RepID=A0A6P8CVX9_PUNGR|nr:laccase-17-like [Punica granatum]XP_031385646.1 laccase-17-like [Punica granatum]